MPSIRDQLLDTKLGNLPPSSLLRVFHGESRSQEQYVTLEIGKLAQKHGEVTLRELVTKLRSRLTGRRPTQVSFVVIDRNRDREVFGVFP